jgi:chromosome segregation ATPase
MKTIIIGLMALILISAFSVAVMAEEDISEFASEDLSNVSEGTLISPSLEENQTVDQETTNEINDELNESVSIVDTTLARIDIWLTFNQEKKAEKELKLARLELIRAKVAALNNNTNAMEKALAAHDRIIAKIQERINSIDGKATKEGVQNSVSKLVGLERAIEVHEARIAKLNEILASANLTDEQIAKIQARLDKAVNNTAHLKDVEAAKIDKLTTRLMAIANITEEEAAAKIEEIKDMQNLSAIKALVSEIKSARAEKIQERLNERINEKAKEAEENETEVNLENETEQQQAEAEENETETE